MNVNNCLIKNFVFLSYSEKRMVLKWRNHNNVRIWMYNKNLIDEISHVRFIESLENNSMNEYLLVAKDKQNIGVIYFNNINQNVKECEFGLYKNPFDCSRGLGKVLIDVALKYAFEILKVKRVYLEVFSSNVRAIHLYRQYTFREYGKKVIDNKEVICMELKDDNR